MKLYATIDDGTIVSSIDESCLPNRNGQEYDVDHVDQLVIEDGKIVVDKTQLNKIEVFKQLNIDRGRLSQLRDLALNHILDKELNNLGLIEISSENQEEFKNILTEYKYLKEKLS
jgi:hypothetical protein